MVNNFDHVGRRIGSLNDLPRELVDQLQTNRPDQLSTDIIETIRFRYNGIANIDEVLVGLYRDTQTVYKRPFIINKLYRMATAGLLYSIPKKKGVYSLEKTEGAEDEVDPLS